MNAILRLKIVGASDQKTRLIVVDRSKRRSTRPARTTRKGWGSWTHYQHFFLLTYPSNSTGSIPR